MLSAEEETPVRAVVNGVSYALTAGWRFGKKPQCKLNVDGVLFDGEIVADHGNRCLAIVQFMRNDSRCSTVVEVSRLVVDNAEPPAPPRRPFKRPSK